MVGTVLCVQYNISCKHWQKGCVIPLVAVPPHEIRCSLFIGFCELCANRMPRPGSLLCWYALHRTIREIKPSSSQF